MIVLDAMLIVVAIVPFTSRVMVIEYTAEDRAGNTSYDYTVQVKDTKANNRSKWQFSHKEQAM